MSLECRHRPARALVGQLGARVGDRVRVCGWVQTLRLQRRIQFVVLRDHSGVVQLTNPRRSGPSRTSGSTRSRSGRRSP
jgi:aspartyl/asparaginyl-tRNA synthetase